MDALEQYQDLSTKTIGGFIPIGKMLPRSFILRVGPRIQQLLISFIQSTKRGSERILIPGGFERVYLYHVRKTAGTSLSRAFLSLGGESPRSVEGRIASSILSRTKSGPYGYATGIGALQQGDYLFGWSHVPAHKLRLPERTFEIATLRDPVARLLSYYRYLVAGDRTDETGWTVQSSERALMGANFEEFLSRIPDELLLTQLYMFSASFDVDEAVDRLLACQELVFTESIVSDTERLATRLEITLDLRKERVTSEEAFEPNDMQVKILRERLAPEYEMMERLTQRLREQGGPRPAD